MLAGGRSTRFGRDKLVEPVRGRPLLHHPIAVLAGLCDEVVVVAGFDTPTPELPSHRRVPIRMVRDLGKDGGPLVGLASGFAEIRSPLAMIAAGDMPDLSPKILRGMLRVIHGASQVEAVVLQEGSSMRPLPAVVRAVAARDAVNGALRKGVTSLHEPLAALECFAVPEEDWRKMDPEGATLHDIDLPEQLP